MPDNLRRDAIGYREKAAELRKQADSNPVHPEAQLYRTMADRYDAMADHAEKLAGSRAHHR
jgi:hypothetical protein